MEKIFEEKQAGKLMHKQSKKIYKIYEKNVWKATDQTKVKNNMVFPDDLYDQISSEAED